MMAKVLVARVVRAGVVALVLGGLLGGCGMKPLVSDESRVTTMSRDEQAAWLESEVDAAMNVLGQTEGWYQHDRTRQWSEIRVQFMQDLRTESCRPSKSGFQPGRLAIRLSNDMFSDPFEAAKRLRAYWEEQGWTVTNVINPDDAKFKIDYFRADREDGALLLFDATENLVVLQVRSACSENNSI